MDKPEVQDVIDCIDSQKLNNWAAQICMGWVNHDETRPDTWFSQYQEGCWLAEEWSPASKTDLGKNQCWDLAEKYHCWPRLRNGEYVVFVTHDVPQKAKDNWRRDLMASISDINKAIFIYNHLEEEGKQQILEVAGYDPKVRYTIDL